ncbi:MAG: DUF1566 domain-containing protein [Bacteroidales bacterium]|nr:DUF1566 domain-containing protein [Bacteroidales bacterium]
MRKSILLAALFAFLACASCSNNYEKIIEKFNLIANDVKKAYAPDSTDVTFNVNIEMNEDGKFEINGYTTVPAAKDSMILALKANNIDADIDIEIIPDVVDPTQSHAATVKPAAQASLNSINGHEYVDLGLSVKWATCNVGANSPGDDGSVFVWAETSPKNDCSLNTWKYRESGDSWNNVKFSKYVASSEYGSVDNKTTLELVDDAARVNWGGSWRMPTIEEQKELINNCTWQWIHQNGDYGYKVTSKKNGKSIFLPAGMGYWSSSLDTRCSRWAYYFLPISDIVEWSFTHRSAMLCVRAVSK